MSFSLQKSILKTIIYADIFDYPLMLEEIWKWLIKINNKEPFDQTQGKQIAKNKIKKLKFIHEKDGYYFLKGREEIVSLRKEREKWSQEKLKITKEIANLLQLIPTIKLVGITGTLAVNNAKKDDDIDLFIITSAGLLWTTRLWSTLLIEFTGMRRHPSESHINNKICLNMFADEEHLELPSKEKDLFSAHEVVQMKPIFNRGNTYQNFLIVNQWVRKYLPNAYNINIKHDLDRKQKAETNLWTNTADRQYLSIFHFPILENLIKRFQLWYMRNRRTTEVINEGIIRFHSQDAREWVMRKYKERLIEFNL